MPVRKLKEFLDQNGVKYVSIKHSLAYTAQEIAALTHVPGRELAKVVMVKADGALAMVVVPAQKRVDLEQLGEQIGVTKVELAHESEFKAEFPECDPGAMPPFGNLYGMEVYVDQIIAADEEIAFNAGSHAELIKLSYRDFERLVNPKIIK